MHYVSNNRSNKAILRIGIYRYAKRKIHTLANFPMDNMITLEEHNKQMQELRDTIQNLNVIISTMRMTMDSL